MNMNEGVTCLSCGHTVFTTENESSDIVEAVQSPSNSDIRNLRYSYMPLGSTSAFRLIRLYPGNREEDVECEIFHSNLDSHPDFEALSYTWGTSDLSEMIYSTEGSLDVTENCAAALKDLRHPSLDRVLWIDAISINQSNNAEKNHQVPLMSKIFAGAKCVVVYLGPDSNRDVRLLFDRLQYGKPSVQDGIPQSSVSTFLSRPWFLRVWVLQEVAVAKRAMIMCGSATLDWRYLSVARLDALGLIPIDDAGKVPPALRIAENDKKPLKDFASLINTARSCLSTNPSDKIYALLGLLRPDVKHNVVIDYSKPVEMLYVEVTMHIINSYNHLDILSDAGKETAKEVEVIKAYEAAKAYRNEDILSNAGVVRTKEFWAFEAYTVKMETLDYFDNRVVMRFFNERSSTQVYESDEVAVKADRKEEETWNELIKVELSSFNNLAKIEKKWEWKPAGESGSHEKSDKERELYKSTAKALLQQKERLRCEWRYWHEMNMAWSKFKVEYGWMWNNFRALRELWRELSRQQEDEERKQKEELRKLAKLEYEQGLIWLQCQLEKEFTPRELKQAILHDLREKTSYRIFRPIIDPNNKNAALIEAVEAVEKARKNWENANTAARRARPDLLTNETALAARIHNTFRSIRASATSKIQRIIGQELHSEVGSTSKHQQSELSVPTWVPDLRRRSSLASLSHFRPTSSISASQKSIAQLCRFEDLHGFLTLEIQILELDIVAKKWEFRYEDGKVDLLSELSHIENHGSTSASMQNFCQGRLRMLTERSWTICTYRADVSDKICIIYGASVPFVLRPTSDGGRQFKLIGECYLNGFRGPTFINDYLELLGEFKQYFDATTAEGLPWQTAYLE